MSINTLSVTFFVLALSSGLVSSYLVWREIEDVNRNLPPNEQIEYAYMYPGKMRKIKIAYGRFYPSGKLERWRFVSQTGMVVFLVLTAVSAGFLR